MITQSPVSEWSHTCTLSTTRTSNMRTLISGSSRFQWASIAFPERRRCPSSGHNASPTTTTRQTSRLVANLPSSYQDPTVAMAAGSRGIRWLPWSAAPEDRMHATGARICRQDCFFLVEDIRIFLSYLLWIRRPLGFGVCLCTWLGGAALALAVYSLSFVPSGSASPSSLLHIVVLV